MRCLLTSLAFNLLLGSAASVLGAAGDLDPTFGGGRFVRTELPDIENGILYAIARQPDGKLVAAGYAETESDEYLLLVLRFLPDGHWTTASGRPARSSPR